MKRCDFSVRWYCRSRKLVHIDSLLEVKNHFTLKKDMKKPFLFLSIFIREIFVSCNVVPVGGVGLSGTGFHTFFAA